MTNKFSTYRSRCIKCGRHFRVLWDTVHRARMREVRELGTKYAGTLEDTVDRITICQTCQGSHVQGEHIS